MSKYENNALIKAIEDKDLRKRALSLVEKILDKSRMIWGYIRYPEMADHGERHTRNVFDLLTRFLVHSQRHLLEGENRLNDSELFCLIIATWLHDIGGMGGGISDKEFLSHGKARKEHPFNGGRIVLDDGTLFLDLKDDEQSAIADTVVTHSCRVELKQLQPKMVGGKSIRTELLAALLSLADACDTQESRVGGFEEVELKLHKLGLLKGEFEAKIQRIERLPSPDKERLEELRKDVEYISAQKDHHYKHLSVKNVFFTPTSIILEKNVLTLPEYDKYFDDALSDVQEKEFERAKWIFSKYGITLKEVRAFDNKDNIKELYKQIEKFEVFPGITYRLKEGIDSRVIVIGNHFNAEKANEFINLLNNQRIKDIETRSKILKNLRDLLPRKSDLKESEKSKTNQIMDLFLRFLNLKPHRRKCMRRWKSDELARVIILRSSHQKMMFSLFLLE